MKSLLLGVAGEWREIPATLAELARYRELGLDYTTTLIFYPDNPKAFEFKSRFSMHSIMTPRQEFTNPDERIVQEKSE